MLTTNLTRPNVFLLGGTQTGKTTLAQHLKEILSPVSASDWVRKNPQTHGMNYQEMTGWSKKALAADPDSCVRHLRAHNPIADGGHLIEGIRNPRDFLLLFQPSLDVVVQVTFEKNPCSTPFEKEGLRVIESQVSWLVTQGIIEPKRFLRFRLDALRGQRGSCGTRDTIPGPPEAFPCWNLDELKIFLEVQLTRILPPKGQGKVLEVNRGGIHFEIPGISVMVDNQVLHDEDPTQTGRTPGEVFGLSLYPGEVPTFQVRLSSGGMFSYVPPHRVKSPYLTKEDQSLLDLKDLVYHMCPRDQAVFNRYEALEGTCQVWLRHQERWVTGDYLGTIDWYTGNDLLHMVLLENGQIAFQPSHKVVFGNTRELPGYKKLHATWTLD